MNPFLYSENQFFLENPLQAIYNFKISKRSRQFFCLVALALILVLTTSGYGQTGQDNAVADARSYTINVKSDGTIVGVGYEATAYATLKTVATASWNVTNPVGSEAIYRESPSTVENGKIITGKKYARPGSILKITITTTDVSLTGYDTSSYYSWIMAKIGFKHNYEHSIQVSNSVVYFTQDVSDLTPEQVGSIIKRERATGAYERKIKECGQIALEMGKDELREVISRLLDYTKVEQKTMCRWEYTPYLYTGGY